MAECAVKPDLSGINVGGNQQGIEAFIATYLDQLLTYGSAVGEMITDGRELYALYNGDTRNLEVRRAGNGLDLCFFSGGEPLPRPELLLYSVLNPEPGAVAGTSLLRGLPFVSRILLQIYNTIGQNWSHAGNLRYAVVYRPGNDAADRAYAGQRAQTMARSWQEAMDASSVKDFVAVGDVDVKVIGADNQVLESEIPVRQMLEQIVAKTGLPPFMFGLSWSTTERMSRQQADLLTTELKNYRRILTPVIEKIGRTYCSAAAAAPPSRWCGRILPCKTRRIRPRPICMRPRRRKSKRRRRNYDRRLCRKELCTGAGGFRGHRRLYPPRVCAGGAVCVLRGAVQQRCGSGS